MAFQRLPLGEVLGVLLISLVATGALAAQVLMP